MVKLKMKSYDAESHAEIIPDPLHSPKRSGKSNRYATASLKDALRRLDTLHAKCSPGTNAKDVKFEAGEDEFVARQKAVERAMKNMQADIEERSRQLSERGSQLAAIELAHHVRKSLEECTGEVAILKRLNVNLEDDIAARKVIMNKPVSVVISFIKKPKSREAQEAELRDLERSLEERQGIADRLVEELEGLAINLQNRPQATAVGWIQRIMGGGGHHAAAVQPNPASDAPRLRRSKLMDLDLESGGGAPERPRGGDVEADLLDGHMQKQMATIAEQDKEIDAQLDNIRSVLREMKVVAVHLGTELDAQSILLKETEKNLEESEDNLKNINKGLKKIMDRMRPANVMLNLCFALVLLGLISYLVWMFRKDLTKEIKKLIPDDITSPTPL